ncbi:MAG: class B sortase [Clostridia bacterium]|nr:class B sortase [Clostridia bacterium]
MQRRIIRFLNSIVSAVVAVVLVLMLLYSAYALWDNQHVYLLADSVQNDLLAFKPQEEEEAAPSFEELQAINPDVNAWLTMEGTHIDFPVVQGSNNFEYLSLDVYGNFSLAGSIYLDSRNSRTYTDAYSLLHGHHLDQGRMFGDLDLYKQRDFFDAHTTGTLLMPEGRYALDVIAYLLVDATDSVIFAPQRWTQDAADVLDFAKEKAVFIHEDAMQRALGVPSDEVRLLCLATCSTEYTDARTIILCLMTRAEQEVSP